MEKRHEGMKTALGSGSQHREKDVNDSGGKEINNARLPLSLLPSVPHSPSSPLPLPSASTLLFVFFSLFLYWPLSCVQITDLTSRGSSPHQVSVAVLPCCVQV